MNYLRLGAYVAAALIAFGAGWKAGSQRWHTKYQTLQAENWQGVAQREETARKALEGQLRDAQATSDRNAKVIHDISEKAAAIAADRDHTAELFHRLLARQGRPPASPSVPQAPDQPGTAPASGASRDDEAAGILADAAGECLRNADRLDALSAQISPQL